MEEGKIAAWTVGATERISAPFGEFVLLDTFERSWKWKKVR
jgi:hypothetical protein